MEHRIDAPESGPDGGKLDFDGMLGADRVFDSKGDLARQAALIDANGNKVGTEGCRAA